MPRPFHRLGWVTHKPTCQQETMDNQPRNLDDYTRPVHDPLEDNISSVDLIDFMGNDLSVVNDARVSYDGYSDTLTEKDIKLINYLIGHKHYSPLRGVVFKFKVKAPLFCARQWWKHHISSCHSEEQDGWNEVSFRYVEIKEPEFYIPKEFRKQSTKNKQKGDELLTDLDHGIVQDMFIFACESSLDTYRILIDRGVCREQARAVLPPAIYTKWIWTTSLQAVLNFIHLRKGEGAQSEITRYAKAIEQLIAPIVPHTIEAFNKHQYTD